MENCVLTVVVSYCNYDFKTSHIVLFCEAQEVIMNKYLQVPQL